jgi:hypothetical protein
MDPKTHELHLAAGRAYGRDATCGKKVDYKSESTADRAAQAMNKFAKTRHELEAYPCAWCEGWHIGRAMTQEELMQVQLGP